MSAITLTAELSRLADLIAFVRQAAQSAGFVPDRIREIELATEEALVNIFQYAYPDVMGKVRIDCRMVNDSRLAVAIADYGIPFNSLDFPDPDVGAGLEDRHTGGLGVFLMKKLTDDRQYRREGNQNILTLVFDKPGSGKDRIGDTAQSEPFDRSESWP
ncbi:MAG: ATP-binding protein [Deltaproteobacteria bacterium]|nr:ATP-binding protein [Deltaproteobacteria bacterium]